MKRRMIDGRQWLVLGTVALLAGCSVSINSGDNSASDQANEATAANAASSSARATEDAPAPVSDEAAGDWRRVRLDGITAGDNFYLDMTPVDGGEQEHVLCTADICRTWFDANEIPANMRDAPVEVQMGTSAQVDGEGTVMEANFPTVTDIRQTSR